MAGTTTTLTVAQIRVMLNAARYCGGGTHAHHLLSYRGIHGHSEIYAAVGAGYFIGPPREHLEAGRVPAGKDESYFDFVLTKQGQRWLDTDKLSVQLRPLREQLSTGMRLKAYIRAFVGTEGADYAKTLHDHGYIDCYFAGDGKPNRVLGNYEIAHAGDFRIQCSNKAREEIS